MQDYEAYNAVENAEFMIKSSWSFTRGMPTGKEAAKGDIELKLPLNTIQPFTDLIQSELSNED